MPKTTILGRLLPIWWRRERDGIVRSLSVPSRSLSIREHSHSLQGERDWTTDSLRFASPITLSLGERGWLDKTFTSFHFHSPLSRRERDGTAQSHSVPSPPFGLRPEAVILDRAVFASLSRGQSNPLRGFSSTHYFTWNKKRSLTASLFVSKEREGFEPSVLWQTPDFETGPFDHSGISPRFA